MCEGMAIANMLQNMNCTKKNDADDTSPLMGSRLDHPVRAERWTLKGILIKF